MLREMQREVNMALHLQTSNTLTILPITIRLSFTQRMTSTVALWPSFHGEKPAGPRIMRKLWSNLMPVYEFT